MATITYTAKRNLKTGHTSGSVYTLSMDITRKDDEQPTAVKTEHISLGGNVVTQLSRVDEFADLTLEYIPDDFIDSHKDAAFNLLSFPSVFSSWTEGGTGVVSSNTTAAPDGTTTADTLTDNDAAANEWVSQAITIEPANAYSASVYIKKDATGRATRFPAIYLTYSGSTSENNRIEIDTSTGDFNTVFNSDSTGADLLDKGDYWLATISATSNDTANTTATVYIYPALGASATWVTGIAATGSVIAWGAMLTDKPTVYDLAEFFHSVSGGETFTIDDGTAQTCMLAGGITRNRFGLKNNYSFRVRYV